MSTHLRPRVGFVLERALGHDSHAANLHHTLSTEARIDAELFDVRWDVTGIQTRLPLFNSNWTVRAGVRARRGIKRMNGDGRLDALFIHTQVPAVLASDWMKRVPTVVSLDATPLQYDQLGEHYEHHRGPRAVEALKYRASKRCFERAAHLVTWSAWAKQGLIDGYAVPPDKVTVIPPGVATPAWEPPGPRTERPGPT